MHPAGKHPAGTPSPQVVFIPQPGAQGIPSGLSRHVGTCALVPRPPDPLLCLWYSKGPRRNQRAALLLKFWG